MNECAGLEVSLIKRIVIVFFFSPFRFFFLMLEAIKKLSAKLASINSVDTRKATSKDTDRDAEDSTNIAVRCRTSEIFL